MNPSFPQHLLPQLNRRILSQMGLEFAQKQWPALESGLSAAAAELGFADLENFAEWLLNADLGPEQVSVLASHLAIGESSFFREPKTLDILKSELLPKLIRRRRQTGCRRLRLWSAGCSNGEEAYSLAIILYDLLPDIVQWDISVLGTDFNMRALEIARIGKYSSRAFRSSPSYVQRRHFTKEGGQFEVLPDIKAMLRFSYLNLLDELYPSVTNGTCDIDVILCRNVLMYFHPQYRARLIEGFSHCLNPGGWLIVGPSELRHVPLNSFRQIAFPQAFFFCKEGSKEDTSATQKINNPDLPDPRTTFGTLRQRQAYEKALTSYGGGNDAEVEKILGVLDEATLAEKTCDLLARACLRQKKFHEALVWNEKTLCGDNFNARFHYLRAKILQKQQDLHEANASLRRSLYLEPQFVLANFDMGLLARQQGRVKEASTYFKNVLALLQHYAPNAILPASDGLQAQTLQKTVAEIIRTKVS